MLFDIDVYAEPATQSEVKKNLWIPSCYMEIIDACCYDVEDATVCFITINTSTIIYTIYIFHQP